MGTVTVVGTRVRELRIAAGLTLKQCADQIGTTNQHLSRLERGEQNIKLSWLTKLADVLKVPTQDLLVPGTEVAGMMEHAHALARIPELAQQLRKQPKVSGKRRRKADNNDGGREETVVDHWHFPPRFLAEELEIAEASARIFKQPGDSMYPTVPNTARCVADSSDGDPAVPGLFIVMIGDVPTCRRLSLNPDGTVNVECDNRDFPGQRLAREDVEIVGRVVWVGARVA